jgi:pyruvate/2-oxoglutarate dehydrogenase complex dihydrolipoamide acyltransferase (E2) component
MTSLDTDQLIQVPMPAMGTSITEGEVIAWLKQPGDPVEADETICEISTDKVDSECPAPVAGVLTEILVSPGEVVEVGAVLARIAPKDGVVAPPATKPAPPGRRFYSPVARRVAAEHGVDLEQVPGTGANGRVNRRDVERFVDEGQAEPLLHSDSPYRPDPPVAPVAPTASATPPAPAASPPAAGAVDGIAALGGDPQPMSRMRMAIGKGMRRSLDTAATAHTVVECDVTKVERRRRELGVTALPLVARATIETLREFPDLNATLDDGTITRFERVHLGIAVSLGDDGLIVPVVKDAQELSAEGLGARIKDLAKRARSQQLSPDEVQDGTFTITSPGAFGATIATPIINLPQVGILDLEAVIRRPVVVEDEDGDESIAIRSMVNLVLGWDHRAIDGVYAARFLSALRERLETSR